MHGLKVNKMLDFISALDWTRTNGLLLRRQPLYPPELRAHI